MPRMRHGRFSTERALTPMEATEGSDVVVLHPAIAVTGRLLFALIFFFP